MQVRIGLRRDEERARRVREPRQLLEERDFALIPTIRREHGNIRMMSLDQRGGFVGGRRLGNDLDLTAAFDQRAQRFADEPLGLDKDNADLLLGLFFQDGGHLVPSTCKTLSYS